VGSTPFFFGGLFFHFFSRVWRFLPKASRMSYHTTINGNQRELKSQNPFYWIGVTPHVAGGTPGWRAQLPASSSAQYCALRGGSSGGCDSRGHDETHVVHHQRPHEDDVFFFVVNIELLIRIDTTEPLRFEVPLAFSNSPPCRMRSTLPHGLMVTVAFFANTTSVVMLNDYGLNGASSAIIIQGCSCLAFAS
jgi:hypothetical protein